jgi:pimeloyl-ACP methyl ester carboxylesterase
MMTELDDLLVDGPVGPIAGWTTGGRNGLTPVLFLHPVNTAGRIWADLAGCLDPARYCLLPDLRGHGASVGRGPFTLQGYIDDALAVLDACGVERVHAVGGSLGGTVAVGLAVRAPERVASIAAFGSMLSLPVTPADLETVAQTIRSLGTRSYFEDIAPGTLSPKAPAGLADQVVSMAVAGGRSPEMVTAILINALRTDAIDLAAEVRCPALVATGEFDAWCTPDVGREMADALAGEYRLLPDTGHLPMLETPAVLAPMLDHHFSAAET